MSKLFRGQVKIEDVKEAFNEIVDRVNNIIDEYNTQVYVNHIDYTSGSKSISPSGYTLSVGGLKQMIKSMDGCVLGCKAFKVSNNKVKMSTGLLFRDNKVIKLPDSIVTVNASTKHIFFDPDINSYSTTTGFKICDINMLRDSKMVTGINNLECEELNKTYKIFTQTKDYTTGHKFVSWSGGFYEHLDNSSKPKFLSAINAQLEGGSQTKLFNTLVDSYAENGDRANQVWIPMMYLYIPKGVSNPYTYFHYGHQVDETGSNQKVLDVIVEK